MTKSRRSGVAGMRGFTLIEMIGVLAIIAILASIVAPRVFNTIADARVISVVETGNATKAVLIDYFRGKGKLPGSANPGQQLVAGGFLEGMPDAKAHVGDSVKFARGMGAAAGSIPGKVPFAYDLDGEGDIDVGPANVVFEFQFHNVNIADAWDLSQMIDGATLSQADGAAADPRGRVVYTAPVGGVVPRLHFYLTHR
jgi:prepilin-type N-terminal cleavage/methylation domain-containing protein